MLKLVLTLARDWSAYRRAMSWSAPSRMNRFFRRLGEVSIWPVDEAAPARA